MSNAKQFALLTADQFNALCKSVNNRQRLLDTDLQKLAVSAVGYSIVHGDVQPANRLLSIMSRSTRKDAMVKFLEVHGCVAWMKSEEKFAFFTRDIQFEGTRLMGINWYDAKKETEIQSEYDFQVVFDKLMKNLQAKLSDKKIKVQHVELYDYLCEASAKYNSVLASQERILVPDYKEEADTITALGDALIDAGVTAPNEKLVTQ